jgi:DNA-binding NarL/FixJ family response regulator
VTESSPVCAIRVFVAIENRFLRESLTRLFRKKADFAITGQASPSEKDSVETAGRDCDVLVGDRLTFNFLSEPATAVEVSAFHAKVILIGMDPDEEQFLSAVRAGINGYLLHDASASDVVAAVRGVSRGESICPPLLCSSLFHFVAQSAKQLFAQGAASKPDLTLRQQQLVALIAKGMTNKEIASQLNLSEFTVRNHVHRILKQVDAESRDEAVQTIRAHGYLTAV